MEGVENTLFWYKPLLGVAELSGLAVVALMGVWMGHFRNGFAWQENPSLEFNWHPLLTTIGLIFLLGNNILVYRTFRGGRKNTLKLIHAGIHIGSFVFTVVALKAAFDSHDLKTPPIPNMYSLHSWMGIITVLLFVMEWIAGFIMFLLPSLGLDKCAKLNLFVARYKTHYMSVHITFGILIFVLASATALLGVTEKMIFGGKYSEMNPEGVLVNAMGILLIEFGFVVVYLATKHQYKRVPIEMVGSVHQN